MTLTAAFAFWLLSFSVPPQRIRLARSAFSPASARIYGCEIVSWIPVRPVARPEIPLESQPSHYVAEISLSFTLADRRLADAHARRMISALLMQAGRSRTPLYLTG